MRYRLRTLLSLRPPRLETWSQRLLQLLLVLGGLGLPVFAANNVLLSIVLLPVGLLLGFGVWAAVVLTAQRVLRPRKTDNRP